MEGSGSRNVRPGGADDRLRAFRVLSRRILEHGSHGRARFDFLRLVLETLADFAKCDGAELRLEERGKCFRCEFRSEGRAFRFETWPIPENPDREVLCRWGVNLTLERLCEAVLNGEYDASSAHFTVGGSFWTGDTGQAISLRFGVGDGLPEEVLIGGDSKSLALIPLPVNGERIGILQLASKRQDHFSGEDVEFYEGIAETLGAALGYRRAQVSLRERVKELTCLYGIARLAEELSASLDEILSGVVRLLPPALLYPEIASARIVLDGRPYTTPGFREDRSRLTSEIFLSGRSRGVVEVSYAEERPEMDEGPFLKEERALIDTVAGELALMIERKESQEDRAKLENQLRHADRLATIGQLTAGVAHELNEPLGNILGFAQLAAKSPGLPKQAAEDIEKIVGSTLHAREVIRKLMIFARKMPPQKTRVSLNRVVEEGLYFLEARCQKAGIRLVRKLSPRLPDVIADPAQLHQVLVNLVVNAIQAMPEGGTLTVGTAATGDQVRLSVEDTGVGIGEDMINQIFLPFFTTKELDQGTGLGLPVVHGIVSSHGGSIEVTSRVQEGTRFEVRLPVSESNGEQ